MSLPGPQTDMPIAEWRVLLAHGDPKSSDHLRSLLTKAGYSVTSVQNGTQARQLLHCDDAPQLAVLDWDLPEVSGIELCRELQADHHRPSHYLLLLTPWNVCNDRVRGLEAGADDCLAKPVDERELQLRLQKGAKTLLERKLRESEANFRDAFECSGLGMALVRLNGDFLRVNGALCDYLGYSGAELRGMNLCSVTRPEHLIPCDTWLQRFYDEGHRRGEFEKQFVTKDGRLTWGLLNVSAILDADDRPVSLVVQINNIDKRKQAEEALRHSEAFLRAVTENVTDLIMVLNEKLQFVYANPAHVNVLGYAPRELIGTECLELIHPEDWQKARAAAGYVQQHGGSRIVEVRMRHQDGSWRYVEGHGGLLRDASGQVEGFAITARVVDERMRARQEIQAAQAETELFLQSIPSVLIGLNSEGVITRWNRVAEKSLGLPAREVVGKHLLHCGVKWMHPDMAAELERWLRAPANFLCDNLPFERDGHRKILGLKGLRVVPAAENEKPWFIISGADVTERKQLEEQLRQAQKMEAIGQLAAGIAHEINTPTQYVSDNIQFLKDSWPAIADAIAAGNALRNAASGVLAETDLSSFDGITEESEIAYLMQEVPNAITQSIEGLQRVAKIVRAIKEFSHPGDEEKHAVDLNKSIQTTVTVTRNEWKYVADLQLELDENLPPVVCLAGEFNQVMVNLIVNASHAIAESLGKDPTKKGMIRITSRRIEQWVEICVSDTGGGIPPEIRSRIFEPFFTTKSVGQGTGQGLALAHSVVVKRHQGQIWFDTEVGKGTTFHIRLPLEATAKP